MNRDTFNAAVESLPYGKKLPNAIYIYAGEEAPAPNEIAEFLDRIRSSVDFSDGFNVLKLSRRDFKLSLLAYPEFFSDPHPALREAMQIDLNTGKIQRTKYSGRPNPPILHRKEAFLPPGHPKILEFQKLTLQEEKAGLFEDPKTIGFKLNWEHLLAEKGLKYQGHVLIEEDTATMESTPRPGLIRNVSFVHRHRTAISRYDLSKPIKSLLEFNALREGGSLFDYGCGLGGDVKGLAALGYNASGWDPIHAPDETKKPADVVNLGYVLNVIEDPNERVATLRDAYAYAESLLVVSTLVAGRESYEDARPYRDGILTKRNTFQKYFDQLELQHFIEEILEVDAVAVGLGVFYVFRNPEAQQDFLSGRNRRVIDWEALNRRLGFERPEKRSKKVRLDLYQRHQELLDDFYRRLLDLGRIPKDDEYARMDEIRSAVRSPLQAERIFVKKFGSEALAMAKEARKSDLLVYLAMDLFGKKPRFKGLSRRLQRDIKAFFNNFKKATSQARELLFMAGDSGEIELACEECQFGVHEEEAFLFHRSLLEELPPLLRIYVQCAAKLYGDPGQADIIKIHVFSGKLTFLIYDDFDNKPLPELLQRIKVNLRRMTVEVFDYSKWHEHQLLYFKTRFLPSDHPQKEKADAFAKKLEKLGLTPEMGYGPSKEQFMELLDTKGLNMNLNKKRAGG